MDLPSIRRAIPCLARCIYTNTAGFGPLPRPVWEDLQRREAAIYEEGLDVLAHDPGWNAEREEWRKLWQEVEALRQRAAGRPASARPARP